VSSAVLPVTTPDNRRPTLTWHIIDQDAAFEVCGIDVQVLPVHHGVYFTRPTDTPSSSRSATPTVKARLEPEPLICLGFMFDESIVYMSDVSEIPERTWDRLLRRESRSKSKTPASDASSRSRTVVNGSSTLSISTRASSSTTTSSTSAPASPSVPAHLPILIIDALWPLRSHPSHVSLIQALTPVLRLRPSMTYLIGSTHPTTHYMWEEICLSFRELDGRREHPDGEVARGLVKRFWESPENQRGVGQSVKEMGARIEPAWDGLVVEVGDGLGEAGWREVGGPRQMAGGWGT